jgi:hypothetical protein
MHNPDVDNRLTKVRPVYIYPTPGKPNQRVYKPFLWDKCGTAPIYAHNPQVAFFFQGFLLNLYSY